MKSFIAAFGFILYFSALQAQEEASRHLDSSLKTHKLGKIELTTDESVYILDLDQNSHEKIKIKFEYTSFHQKCLSSNLMTIRNGQLINYGCAYKTSEKRERKKTLRLELTDSSALKRGKKQRLAVKMKKKKKYGKDLDIKLEIVSGAQDKISKSPVFIHKIFGEKFVLETSEDDKAISQVSRQNYRSPALEDSNKSNSVMER